MFILRFALRRHSLVLVTNLAEELHVQVAQAGSYIGSLQLVIVILESNHFGVILNTLSVNTSCSPMFHYICQASQHPSRPKVC